MKHMRLTNYLSKQCTTYTETPFGQRRQVKHVAGYFIRNVADNYFETTVLDILLFKTA